MSSALCSVAIEIVEPARNTGSSTAYGVDRAGAADVDVDLRSSFVCACCAGNLNAVAQRGNFAVVPSRSRSARSSTLMTTPSVSNSSVAPPVAPTRWQNARTASMPAQRCQCGSTGSPHVAQRLEHLACVVSCAALTPVVGSADHELIHERAESRRLRHQRRIEIPHRAGGGVARVREERLAGLLPLAVHALERRARQVHLAADLDAPARRRRAATAESRGSCGRCGHVLAADAVAARRAAHQPAVLVGERDAQAVDLQLGDVRDRRVADARALAGRARRTRAAPLRCRRCRG